MSLAPLPAGGEAGLAHICAAWPELVRRCGVRSPVLGRVLAVVRPVAFDDDLVAVEAPPRDADVDGAAETRGTLRRREVHLAIAQITRDMLGVALRIRVREPEAAPRVARAVETDLRAHPVVQLVTECTGGRLLDIQRRESPIAAPPDGGAHA